MRYITMRRRYTEQIVRTASINSNEVIRGTREFLQIFRKFFIKVPVLSPFILEGACGILQ